MDSRGSLSDGSCRRLRRRVVLDLSCGRVGGEDILFCNRQLDDSSHPMVRLVFRLLKDNRLYNDW